jgi:hypothetical protein
MPWGKWGKPHGSKWKCRDTNLIPVSLVDSLRLQLSAPRDTVDGAVITGAVVETSPTTPRAVSSATKSPARAHTVHVLETLFKDKRTAPARRCVVSTDRYCISNAIYITIYRGRLQAKIIKLGLSLSLLTQVYYLRFFRLLLCGGNHELRISLLRKENTHIAPRHVTGLCIMVLCLDIQTFNGVITWEARSLLWRHNFQKYWSPPPHHEVVTSCRALLLLYVGGRIVLRLIWSNVSNAVPKLLSKDEPNDKKKSLNYLDTNSFHHFKLKICTGHIDDVFTNDVYRNKTSNTNTLGSNGCSRFVADGKPCLYVLFNNNQHRTQIHQMYKNYCYYWHRYVSVNCGHFRINGIHLGRFGRLHNWL